MPHLGILLDKPVQIAGLLAAGLKDRADEAALVSLEGAWSWSELEQRIDRLAAHYLALGLKPGDRLASLMPKG
jgi:long-chain acyl-CoA synthetase